MIDISKWPAPQELAKHILQSTTSRSSVTDAKKLLMYRDVLQGQSFEAAGAALGVSRTRANQMFVKWLRIIRLGAHVMLDEKSIGAWEHRVIEIRKHPELAQYLAALAQALADNAKAYTFEFTAPEQVASLIANAQLPIHSCLKDRRSIKALLRVTSGEKLGAVARSWGVANPEVSKLIANWGWNLEAFARAHRLKIPRRTGMLASHPNPEYMKYWQVLTEKLLEELPAAIGED